MELPVPRPQIAALPAYVPGSRGVPGAAPPIKLSSNESPWGPLPSVEAAVQRAASTMHRYPDMFAVDLHERIADIWGVDPQAVTVGGGSVAVLAHILQAYTAPGDEVVFAWRSFEAYPILTAVAGADAVAVPLDSDARHDLAAMAAAVTERTRVVMICSPNNPTGPTVRADEFDAFMSAVPRSVLVVLDEAYAEFVRDPDAVTGRDVLGRHPNLLVLRTFSKAYGLAGLRVGYAVGPQPLIAPVRSCVTPFSVSSAAQAAALASLDVDEELAQRVEDTVNERERVRSELIKAGWDVPHAEGNFVWLPAGERASALAATLAAREPAVLVRPFAGEGIRVTVGAPHENNGLLEALESVAAGPIA